MRHLALDFDPYANEPARWGASLLNDAELLIACLDAARPARWSRSAPTRAT